MLATGDAVPAATLFDLDRRPVALSDLYADGPILLFFYLFDWSGT